MHKTLLLLLLLVPSWSFAEAGSLSDMFLDTGSKSCMTYGEIKLGGFVVSQSIVLEPNKRNSIVYLLNLQAPVCVKVEPVDVGETKVVMVNRFQLVSYGNGEMMESIKKHLFKEVFITGLLSTDNLSQYYIESNAIDVKLIE